MVNYLLIIILLHLMAPAVTAIVLVLLPVLLAVAPLSATTLPLRVSHLELHYTPGNLGSSQNAFQVAQNYRIGDRIAFGTAGLKLKGPINFLLREYLNWDIKRLDQDNRIVLESTASSSQRHLIVQVSLMIIGKEWDQKTIFLQDLKLTQASSIKHLQNDLILTASSSNKFASKIGAEMPLREVLILCRGFEVRREASKAMVSLRGHFIDSQHIHIHTQLINIVNCHITLVIVDQAQLAHFHLRLARSPAEDIDILGSHSLALPKAEFAFKECTSGLRSEGEEQCWSMQPPIQVFEFLRIGNATRYSAVNFEQEKDNQLEEFTLHGKNRLLSSYGCKSSSCNCGTAFANAATCFEDNACKCKISSCVAGFYTTATLVTSCTACPANLTHCTNCALQFGTTNVTCTACTPGFVPLNKVCVTCPVGCATCTTVLVNKVATVTCVTCLATLVLQSSGSLKVCGCSSNQFLKTTPSPAACGSCPSACLTCTSLTACTACVGGYYKSGSTCLACMPVCKTCSAAGTCLTCLSTATLVSSVCTCPALTFFNPTTKTCLACATLKPNCGTCVYSGGSFNPATPSSVICSTANVGFYVNSGSAVACVPYCSNCDLTPTPVCSTCKASFVFDGTNCVCPPTFYFSTTQNTCLACSTVIPGCSSCQTNVIPTATSCLSCNSAFWPIATPTPTCTACPSLCLTCSSATVCITCVNNLTIISNVCGCDSGVSLYLSPTTLSCEFCSTAIFGCQSCTAAPTGVTCATPSPGFYTGPGNTACYACPSTCTACSSSTTCTACQTGYVLGSGTCACDTICGDCLTASNNTCSNCVIAPFSCNACAVGYYNNNGTCTVCSTLFPKCTACTITSCSACASPFILIPTGCDCDNSAGLFLSVDTLTCQTCVTVIPNCQTCAKSGATTICSVSSPGYFIVATSLSCQPCTGGCLTCSLSSTNCLTCLATYSMVTANNCGCDNSANLYYNPATTGCSLCTTIIPNCQICSTTVLVTTCTQCSGSFFWDSGNSICSSCSPQCTTCSSYSVCTACPNNLVLSETVPGFVTAGVCVCDNTTLPLSYYDSSSATCQPCDYFYTTCTACYVSGSSVLCSSTSGSTYLVGGAAVNCPTPCSTCDAAGCLSCPAGMTLTNATCVCDTLCTDCGSLSLGCTSCTITGSTVSSCSACTPGTYLSSPDCLSCPVTCATCTSLTSCLTCQPSYVLIDDMCSCPLTLGIFADATGTCRACASIFYACTECQSSSGSTVCSTCSDGYYVQGSQCSTCSSSCLTCSGSATTCTSCADGQSLTGGGACVCSSPACISCNALSPHCTNCVFTIYGVFSKCGTCMPDYYLNGNACSPCPSACQSCGAGGACLTCPDTFEVIATTCACNSAQNMWQSAGICVKCDSLYSNCATCSQNTAVALNVTCQACVVNYYLLAGICTQSVCGDGVITSGEACDDGNLVSGDGCNDYCLIESSFTCTGQPSKCSVNINYFITLKSIVTSTSTCNQLDISFNVKPVYAGYDSANFQKMLSYTSEGGLTYKKWAYASGVVTYTLSYSLSVSKEAVSFYFAPAALGLTETATIPIIVVNVVMTPTNNVQLLHYDESTCKAKENMKQLTKAVEYASYGTLIASALPCKIVGLELFGVLQLAHINVGNMDSVNTLMTPLMGLKGVHGFSMNLGQEGSKSRRLQTTYTPTRVQSIGYESNFLRNCNVMLMIVVAVVMVSLVLFICTWLCQACAPCLHSISKRIIKEVLLTLILFNCFNFAYSAGLHFNYAPKDDALYTPATVAAVLALTLPLLMALALMCAEDDGFGEYKEKFKPGLVERLYFVVTILYRSGIGLYISSANEDSMSTLIVMGLSIAFLLYNLVNLPYAKAYHNYRANVCHFAQFICLFVAMYYRSMMSSASTSSIAQVYTPVYIQMGAIVLSLVVSVLVLVYEIYLFVLDCCCKKDDTRKQTKVSNESSHADEKHLSEANIESFTNEKKFDLESL